MALIKCRECGSQVSSKAEACPKCGVKMKKKTGCGTMVVALLLAPFVFVAVNSVLSPSSSSSFSDSTRELKEDIRNQIKLDWEWQKAGFGNVMEADFRITNSSSYDIKDVEIQTNQSGKSGTKIDRNTRTIYEIIKAGETKEFKKFNMGFIHSQSDSASATIIDFAIIK